MPYTYRFPRPMLAADIVVVAPIAGRLHVLLIQRKREPFRGQWATPGGFVEIDEEIAAGARRELLEETGVEATALREIGTFGAVGRDPRGRVISVVFLALAVRPPRAAAGDDAAEARWFPWRRLPSLAFDHARVLLCARRALRALTERELLALALLPRTFSLVDAEHILAEVLGRSVDARVLRKRGVLVAAGDGRYRVDRRAVRRASGMLRLL